MLQHYTHCVLLPRRLRQLYSCIACARHDCSLLAAACGFVCALQLVNKAAAKFDQMQLTSFLDAAANGDVDVVQDMLRQGMNPNTADYDGRTALMIAAYKGKKVSRSSCFMICF